jgi:hypothetical protein
MAAEIIPLIILVLAALIPILLMLPSLLELFTGWDSRKEDAPHSRGSESSR